MARRMDYKGFCDQEIEFRQELRYPPVTRLACITLKGPSDEKVSFFAATLARRLKQKMSKKVIVSDSAPAPISRAKGLYRYQVMTRSAAPLAMIQTIKEIISSFKLPPEASCSVDIDAISLL